MIRPARCAVGGAVGAAVVGGAVGAAVVGGAVGGCMIDKITLDKK